MTMHLAHPSLSTGGKKKGKQKFRNAQQAKQARELADSWTELQKKWGVDPNQKAKKSKSTEKLTYSLPTPVGRTNTHHIPSHSTKGGSTSTVHKVYTGDQVLGVTIVHKSCLQPVFNQQQAIDAASMRR
jgi:hypothetical protein